MHKLTIITTGLFLLMLGILFTCTLPTPPPGAEAAKIELYLKSSSGMHETSITDSVGKIVSIGVILNLTPYIDSTIITVQLANLVEKSFKTTSKKVVVDTVFFPISFTTAGIRAVTATGYISSSGTLYPNSEDTASITIIGTTSPSVNSKPVLTVQHTKLVVAGETLILHVTASEPDLGQTATITATKKPANALFSNDTLRWPTTLSDVGIDTVIFVATDNGSPALSTTDTVFVTVAAPLGDQPPVLTVSGRHAAAAGSTVVLVVAATDADTTQEVTVEATYLPEGATFINDTLRWTTTLADTGIDSVIFVATDSGDRALTDTKVVLITIATTLQNTPPVWSSDTLHLTGNAGVLTTHSLLMLYTDPEGDSVTLAQLPGAPTGATLAKGVWQFTPAAPDTGKLLAQIVATDALGAADTLVIEVTVPVVTTDITPPVLHRIAPAHDSLTITTPNYDVKISGTDASGIATVTCSMGGSAFATSRSADTLYTATVTGLQPAVWNIVRFIATDSSEAANSCTLFVALTYDSIAPDNVPPSITLHSPSKDTAVLDDSCLVTVRCTDASGVANVKIGTVEAARQAGDIFSATVKGLVAGKNTVSIIATDSATTPHKDSASIVIIYDNDATGPTLTRVVPIKDGTSTNASSFTFTLASSDPWGVASVNGVMGTATFTGVRSSGDNWTITVKDLPEGVSSAIAFTATDSSLRKNSAELTLHITYDPTMDDVDGPTFTAVSGPASGEVVTTGTVTIVTAIADPSGIESATWTLNAGAPQPMTAVAGKEGQYQLAATFTAAGDYEIVMTAVDNSSKKISSSQTVTLTYAVPPAITTEPVATSVCKGSDATVKVVATGTAPLAYQWKNGTSNVTGATDATYTFTPNATVTLTCEVSNSGGTKTSVPCTVTLNEDVTLKITGATEVCSGSSITLTAAATGGSSHTFKWNTGAATETLSVTAAGKYSCTATSSAGCTGSAEFTVGATVVSTKPTIRVKSGSSSTVCPGGSVEVEHVPGTGSLGTGATWQWFNNGVKTDNDGKESISAYPTATGTKYTLKAAGGPCGAEPESDPITVTLKTLPTAPVGLATPSSLCLGGGQVTLGVSSGNTGTGGSWKWYESNKTTAVTVNPFSPTVTKTYYVRSEGGCSVGSWSGPVEVTVNQPATTPTGVASPSTVCYGDGQKVAFSVTGGNAGTGGSWVWYLNKTIKVSSPITPSVSGTYYVRSENAACGTGLWSGPVEVTVNTPSLDHPEGSPQIDVCIDDPITITTDCAVSYQWWIDPWGTGNYSLVSETSTSEAGQGTSTLRSLTSAGSYVFCTVTFADKTKKNTGVWFWGIMFCP